MSSINDDENKDEFYSAHRSLDKTYFSKAFTSNYDKLARKKRFAHKLLDYQGNEFIAKDQKTLSYSINGRRQLRATFFEDSKQIEKLILQGFNSNGQPVNDKSRQASFRGIEVERLYLFLRSIKEVDLPNDSKFNVKDSELLNMLLNRDQASKLIQDNIDLLQDALKNNVTTKDLINFGYRKNQLEIFERLMSDSEYFESYRRELEEESGKGVKNEMVWQKFFDKNTWILGYGLDYIFNSELDSKKLEQVTSGPNFNNGGKRIDGLLKSLGVINSLCFCELKLSSDSLLKQVSKPYRSESWQISDSLAGAIAQVQRTVHKAVKDIDTKTEMRDRQDHLTGETLFFYNPKATIIIGNLNEFIADGRINELKYSSFEMFRKSLKNIDVITYDELYQRAYYICHNRE